MALYALSDLHLSFTQHKPMDIFGPAWENHEEKIKNNWISTVGEEDTVLLGGDLSWSMTHEEALKELRFIDSLPGRKIIIRGNHDYWWGSIKKLNALSPSMDFIQNNFFTFEDIAVCGTRGWTCEGSEKFTEEDFKIYDRERQRLINSLKPAKDKGYERIIAMIHYPPFNESREDSIFTDLFEEYGVEKVIYGHLHGNALKSAFTGMRNGVEYICTSGDYLDFRPLKIL